jgi:hypothetical protein
VGALHEGATEPRASGRYFVPISTSFHGQDKKGNSIYVFRYIKEVFITVRVPVLNACEN